MAVNKVVVNGEAIIDLSADTVTANKLAKGYKAHDKSGAVIIGTMEGGGEPVQSKDVNFIDYDGTVLHSYTVAEAAALTALPPLPSHDGLICQGWNWTLADIKALGRAVTVGAMYITDDGKTRIYIHLEEGRTSPKLGCCPKGTVTVDWGDGTTPDTLTGTSVSTVKWTPTHEYSAAGDYVIKLSVSGSVSFAGINSLNQYSYLLRYSSGADLRNQVYQSALQKVEIGDGVTLISSFAFARCYSLSSITIPGSVTSIGGFAFQNCYSLLSITIPNGVTSIGNNAFQNCYSLLSITIPNGVTSIGSNAFHYCQSLSSITIPNSVTLIGNGAFQNCYSLLSITIPDGVTSIGSNAFQNCQSLLSITIRDGVTSIGSNAFNSCQSLSSITIPNSVTLIGNGAFNSCYSLSSITIPDGVTSIGIYTFFYCYSLLSITIPNGVTSISNNAFQNCYSLLSITIPDGVTSISNNAFQNCYSLSSITIPDGVTSISNNAFQNCYGVRYYDFTRHTAVPTLSNTNAFDNIAADCEIRVPAALADEWKAATNWSTYASYIVGV